MKNLKQVLVAILFLTSIISCKKDEPEPDFTLEMQTISAKWIVSGTSDFKSFEFNKSGNYIVVKKGTKSSETDQVLFGTYQITDNKTVVLKDFGILEVSTIEGETIRFNLAVNSDPGTKVSINASKSAVISNSTKTELLCRTWEMVSVNGEVVSGTEYELTVLFTNAGTYFVTLTNPDEESEGGLAQWKWKDETETKFLYSWEEYPVWEEEDEVEIIELSENLLKILEKYEDDYEELYVMQPVNNSKSTSINADIMPMENGIRSGLLRK